MVSLSCQFDSVADLNATLTGAFSWPANFYDEMKAFSASDKESIKTRILNICGNSRTFDSCLATVGIRSDIGAWTLVFCLYLEVMTFLVAVPSGLIAVVIMFPVALIPCRCVPSFCMVDDTGLSPYTARIVDQWISLLFCFGLLMQGVIWLALSPLVCVVWLIRYCAINDKRC